MKITEKLPQFKNSPSLLVITGWQAGKIYYAHNGEMELLRDIEEEKRQYSDKEGFFKVKSRNVGSMQSGAPLEEDKDIIRRDFLNEFIDALNKAIKENNIEDIYLFSPGEGLHSFDNSLDKKIKEKIKSYYLGNYYNLKPFDILEKIDKDKPKPVELMSEEAKKILEKGL